MTIQGKAKSMYSKKRDFRCTVLLHNDDGDGWRYTFFFFADTAKTTLWIFPSCFSPSIYTSISSTIFFPAHLIQKLSASSIWSLFHSDIEMIPLHRIYHFFPCIMYHFKSDYVMSAKRNNKGTLSYHISAYVNTLLMNIECQRIFRSRGRKIKEIADNRDNLASFKHFMKDQI